MAAISRFFEPPRLRTLADEEDERRATWLELFFDLVFVVAIAALGQSLSNEATFVGFLKFLALFVPVWWAWMGFTFYANRFDTDDLPYRLLILLAMLGVAALSTTVTDAFSGGSRGFALAYVSVRLVLLVLYARAIKHVEPARKLATLYFCAFGAAVVVWLSSLLFAEPARYWLWALALSIELTAPLFGWRLIPKTPVDPRHAPERLGLLTIIVLGESVFAVVLGVQGVSWHASSLLAALAGFLCAASLWWIYFEFDNPEFLLSSLHQGRRLLGGLVFTYGHFPIIVGLAALGIGVKLAILSAGGDAHYDETAWVLCAGLALTMGGLTAIELVTPPIGLGTDVWLRLGTAALAVALIPFTSVLSPVAIVWILAAVLVVQVVFELAGHEEHAAPGPI
ncbi:MAG TPA: low temperature requirement protein A [Gaiellaceae bacterium]|jgi:low temperature requirement protein LtrA|nr:low temperature requirement protein A [Gaiellaceae bacterium]